MKKLWRTTLYVSILSVLASFGAQAGDLGDEPIIWYDYDDAGIDKPEARDPNVFWDAIHDAIVLPTYRLIDFNRWVRHIGTAFGGDHVLPANNVNALDEVPNNSWFTNRIGLFPMSPQEAANGPGAGTGPDRSAPWAVVSAKTEGITPGFNIRDAKGDVYLIKFDPKGFLGTTSTADVVVSRLFHASGFNVPDDLTVTFKRQDLNLG